MELMRLAKAVPHPLSAKTIMHAWKVGQLNAAGMHTHSFLASPLGPPTLVGPGSIQRYSDAHPAATC